MKKIVTFASALAVLAAMPALANQVGDTKDHKPTRPMFTQMDTNADGFVTQDEAVAYTQKKFAEADTNGDGKISTNEADTFRAKTRDMWKEKKGY